MMRLLAVALVLAVSPATPRLLVQEPLSIFLVVDYSRSAAGRMFPINAPGPAEALIGELVRRSFVAHMRPTDRARVGAFGARLYATPGFVPPSPELGERIDVLFGMDIRERLGPSPIWDAAAEAVRALGLQNGRRAMILLTDGEASRSRLTVDDLATLARSHGVAISVISLAFDLDIEQSDGTIEHYYPNTRLRNLAAATGGRFIPRGRETPYRIHRDPTNRSDIQRMGADTWENPGEAIETALKGIQRQ